MEELETIDLREYIHIIRKRIWIIILITAVAVLSSSVISFFILPSVYETATTMMIGKPKEQEQRMEYNDVLLSQKLVKTYGKLAESRLVSSEVIEDLGLTITPEEFIQKINVSPVQDTEIIMIKVQDRNPKLAAAIANDLALVFQKYVTNIMKVDNVQIIDKAEIPKEPVKPKPLFNMAIAGFLGIMVGFGVVFLLEYLDNTIKTPNDVEKYLELPIIGVIPIVEEKTAEKA
jgi:capsular polysaccharide biosynthesis protein